MELNFSIQSDFEEPNCLSSQIHTDNEVYIEEGSSLIISEDFDPPQQAISFLAQQTSEIDIQDDEDESDYQYLIEKMTFTPEALNEYDSQCVTQQKSNVRSRKICRICSKSVFDLRRHLEQCHKELDHLQVVKIVAESKRFRKDLKKKPTKAIRNVLLCPYSNEKGEICGRPIVEYKLYQHLKFYHDIHPKSAEGIRLVKQARANPFAVKSVFPDSSENRLDFINDSTSGYSTSNFIPDYESDHAEYCISFPNEENSSNLPIYSETNNAQSQILTHSVPHSIMTPQTYSSLMQPQSSLSPPGISCCVVSICLNIAIAPLETQDL